MILATFFFIFNAVGFQAHAHTSSCLGLLLRQTEMEELILRGTPDQQIHETKEIVKWFRAHSDRVDELLAQTPRSPEADAELKTLAQKMHEKLREWSVLVRLTQAAKFDPVVAESGESVIEIYLRTLEAAPQIEQHPPAMRMQKFPEVFRNTPIEMLRRTTASKGLTLKFSHHADRLESGGLGWFEQQSGSFAASHRMLAEMQYGPTELHELVHMRIWAEQTAGKEVLFAGRIIPPSGHEFFLEEFVAHDASRNAAIHSLSSNSLSPLVRREFLLELSGEITTLRKLKNQVSKTLKRAEELLLGENKSKQKKPIYLDLEYVSQHELSPAKLEAGWTFDLVPNARDPEYLVFEFPFQDKNTDWIRKRSARRLKVLNQYLESIEAPLRSLEKTLGHKELESELPELISEIQSANQELQDALKKAETEYKKFLRSR